MADQALDIVLTVVKTIIELSQTAKRNKQQSLLLGERVRLLQAPLVALRQNRGSSITVDQINALQNVLEECKDFMLALAGKGKFKAMFSAKDDAETLVHLSQMLDTRTQALQLALSARIAINGGEEKKAATDDNQSSINMMSALERIQLGQSRLEDLSADVKEMVESNMEEMKASFSSMAQEQMSLAAANVAQELRSTLINSLQRVGDLESLPKHLEDFSRSQNQMMTMCKGMQQKLASLEGGVAKHGQELSAVRDIILKSASAQESLVSLQKSVQNSLLSMEVEQRKGFKESRQQMDGILSNVMSAQSAVRSLSEEQRSQFADLRQTADVSQQKLLDVENHLSSLSEAIASTTNNQKQMMELLTDLNQSCLESSAAQKKELASLRKSIDGIASSSAKKEDVAAIEKRCASIEDMLRKEFQQAREASKTSEDLVKAQQSLVPAVESMKEQLAAVQQRQEQEISDVNKKLDEMLRLQRAAGNAKSSRRADLIAAMPPESSDFFALMEEFQREASSNTSLIRDQLDSFGDSISALKSGQEGLIRGQKQVASKLDTLETELMKEAAEAKERLNSILEISQSIDRKVDSQSGKLDAIAAKLDNMSLGPNNTNSGSIMSTVLEISEAELKDMKKIAQGAFGTVYLANWRLREVAVKFLEEQHMDANSLGEFRNEATILSNLKHENIVQLYGVSTTPPSVYMVMEYLPMSLRQLLDKGELTPDVKISLAFDVACGMLYLIKLKPPVIHRDLKSLNVLVDTYMRAKIADFGLSKRKTYATKKSVSNSESTVGTVSWMAPELLLAEGAPRYGEKTDVYSYGVVLWEIITNAAPFKELSEPQIIARVAMGKPLEVTPGSVFGENGKLVNPILLELATKCMARDPQQRPTFEDIANALYAIMPKKGTGFLMPSAGPAPSSASGTGGGSSGGSASSSAPASSSSASTSTSQLMRIEGFNALQVLQSQKLKDMWSMSFGQSVKDVGVPMFSEGLKFALECEDADADRLVPLIVTACDKNNDGIVSVFELAQVERKQPGLLGPLVPQAASPIVPAAPALIEEPVPRPSASVQPAASFHMDTVILVGSSYEIDRQRSQAQFQGKSIKTFFSLGEAIASLKRDGDILHVCPGEYRESITLSGARTLRIVGLLPPSAPASERPAVVFIGVASDRPIFSFTGGQSELKGIKIRQAGEVPAVSITGGHATLEGCDIVGGSQGIEVLGDSADSLIRDCRIEDSKKQGISIDNKARSQVVNTQITRSVLSCVRVAGGAIVSMTGSKMSFSESGHGAVFDQKASGEIADCEFSDNNASGLMADNEATLRVSGCKAMRNKSTGMFFSTESRGQCDRCESNDNEKSGFSLKANSSVRLADCAAAFNAAHGFIFENVTTSSDRCNSHDNKDCGFLFTEAKVRVQSCISKSNKDSGYWIQTKSSSTIDDCEASSNGGNGLTVLDSDPRILTVRAFKNTGSGFSFQRGSSPTVDRCEMYENGRSGMIVTSSSSPRVSDCTMRDSKMHGISIEGAEGSYESCTIRNSENHAINIAGAGVTRNTYIRRCTLIGGKNSGIRIENEASPIIEDVTCESFTKTGLVSVAKTSPMVTRSRFHKNQMYGMCFEAGSKAEVDQCEADENKDCGFLLSGEDSTPRINRCNAKNNVDAGFWAQKNAQGTIIDCTSTGGKNGYVFQNEASPTLISCSVTNTAKWGFTIAASASTKLQKCSATSCKEGGIRFDEGSKGSAKECMSNGTPFTYAFGAAAAAARAPSAAVAAAGDSSLYWSSGILNNVAISSLTGWELSYTKPYSHSCTVAELQALSGENVLVGARKAGSSSLFVCAMAKKSEAFLLGESTSVARPVNGAYWYCVDKKAFGFAPTPSIALGSADTVDASSDQRISWHLSGSGGWRAGSNTGLNSSSEWEKVIFTSKAPIPVSAPPSASALFWKPGVLNEIPLSSLSGWTLSYSKPASHKTTLAELKALPGTAVLVAGHKVGSDILQVAAMAMKDEAFLESSSTSEARAVNGAYWYTVPEKSFGFAPNKAINLGAADTVDRDSSDQRISWHIDEKSGGWRIGKATGLNDSAEWEKYIYTASPSKAPENSAPTFARVEGAVWSSGIMKDLPISALDGWEIGYCHPYSHITTLEELKALPGNAFVVGARKTGSANLFVCAMANKSDALLASDSTTLARSVNGAYWYCVDKKAFGFAPTAKIELGSADTVDKSSDERISWHLSGSAGWRAGSNTGLNSSAEWEKIIFVRRQSVVTPPSGTIVWKSGVQNDVPISSLNGWTLAYSKPASHKTTLDELKALSGGNAVLVAGRKVGSGTLSLAAMGMRSDVFNPTSSTTEAYESNGVFWYCFDEKAFGFAPNKNINLGQADTVDKENNQRISWHLDKKSGGWRNGKATGLNDSIEWEKLIFVGQAPAPASAGSGGSDLFWKQGIHNNVAISSLNGWEMTYCKPYSHVCTADELKALSGDIVLAGARKTGSSTLFVCAMAKKSEAFLAGDSTTVAHLANGAYWYFVNNKSFGFAPNASIDLGSADTVEKESDKRISWHLSGSGGWRAGSNTGLNSSSEWEKVIFTRKAGGGSPAASSPKAVSIASSSSSAALAATPFWRSGIQNDVAVSSLTGWTQSYCKPYSHVTTLEELKALPGNAVLVAGRKAGSSTLFVAAMALKSEAVDVSSSSTTVARPVNGAFWYCVTGKAFGFAPNETIALGSADTVESSSDQRISWHISGSGGWRCGSKTGLNSSSEYEKVIYTASFPASSLSGSLYWKSGIQQNVSISSLNGWTMARSDAYSTKTLMEDLQNTPGNIVLVGSRKTGSSSMINLAMASKSDAFKITSSMSEAHPANGSFWYCVTDKSFGFAPNKTITLGAADTAESSSNERISWHIDKTSGGWRAGANTGLNGSSEFEKVIFYSWQTPSSAVWREGIHNDMPVSSFPGYTLSYCKPYSHACTLAELQAVPGTKWVIGARKAGSSTLFVCAMANKSDAIKTSESTSAARACNGYYIYCVDKKAFGFAPTASIALGSADTVDASSNQRISWHLSGSGGWRAGSNTGLNSSSEWEKVIFTSN